MARNEIPPSLLQSALKRSLQDHTWARLAHLYVQT